MAAQSPRSGRVWYLWKRGVPCCNLHCIASIGWIAWRVRRGPHRPSMVIVVLHHGPDHMRDAMRGRRAGAPARRAPNTPVPESRRAKAGNADAPLPTRLPSAYMI